MTREGMYRLIQACVEGDIDYVTEEGISIIQRGEHGTNQLSPVLDALMDRYLYGAGRDMQLSVRSLATASGVGEEMIRNAASFLVVELMRQGRSPAQACREAIDRVVRKRPEASRTLQVCFLAMNKQGEVGAYALHRGFVYAVCDAQRQDDLRDSPSIYTSTQA